MNANCMRSHLLPQPTRQQIQRQSVFTMVLTFSIVALLCAATIVPSRAMASLTVQSATGRIAGGARHTLYVQEDGTVWAWGDNRSGQLGDGTYISRSTPAQVVNLSNVVAVAAGPKHSLALKSDGTVWSWGSNLFGQLGDGSQASHNVPAKVIGVQNVVAIAAGGDVWAEEYSGPSLVYSALGYSLALKVDGTVWGWGSNGFYDLSPNGTAQYLSPVQLPGLNNVVSISTVSHGGYASGRTSAVLGDGTVWQCCTNDVKQVVGLTKTSFFVGERALQHDGSVLEESLIGGNWVAVSGVTGIARISGSVSFVPPFDGFMHYLYLAQNGTVWASGRNDFGEVGDGTTVARPAPVRVGGLSEIVAIASGTNHSIALSSNGTVWTWGDNRFGQLGTGSANYVGAPTLVPGLGGIALGVTMGKNALAIKSNGEIIRWGSGNGLPTSVPGITNAIDAALTANLALAVKADGSVVNWNPTSPAPAVRQDITKVAQIVAGPEHVVARKRDGTVWAFGKNSYGQIGDGSFLDKATSVQVPSLQGVVSVAAGTANTLALKTDGTVLGWGANEFGQLGPNVSTANHSSPVTISGVSGAVGIASGSNHSVAFKADGTVWAWGDNSAGQLGDGRFIANAVPRQVPGLLNVSGIAAGGDSSYALKRDGTVYAWGAYAASSRPKQIAPAFFKKITASGTNVIVIDLAGGLWASGDNTNGQLGLGFAPSPSSLVPKRVYDVQSTALNSIAVTEFSNLAIGAGHYFITADPVEAVAIDGGAAGPGWTRSGRGFRAWRNASAAPTGAKPVCRFYAGGPNSHFFTADAAECASLRQQNPTNEATLGWKFESIDFFGMTPTNGACPNGYHPVFRAYNNRFTYNDSNHRISSSFIDHTRLVNFLGSADEGLAFCSPVSSLAGGDLHAYHVFPGTEVVSGDSLTAKFFFSNNGPGRADGARAAVILPTEVTDWQVDCSAQNGASCKSLTSAELRSGFVLAALPAGGTLSFTVRGTAPIVSGSTALQLRFGNTIQPPDQAPDSFVNNNTSNITSTFVKNAVACSYGVPIPQTVFSEVGGASELTIATNSGCPLQVGSDVPWVSLAVSGRRVAVNVQPNLTGSRRTGNVSIAGQPLRVDEEPELPPLSPTSPPVGEECVKSLVPSGVVIASNATPGIVSISATSSTCAWSAVADSPWLSLIAGASGYGGGSLLYQAEPNSSEDVRVGRISIKGKVFTIVQHPAAADSSGMTGGGGDSGGDGGSGSGGDSGGDSG